MCQSAEMLHGPDEDVPRLLPHLPLLEIRISGGQSET